MGLITAFILPWIWMMIIGLALMGTMSQGFGSYGYSYDSMMGSAIVITLIMYGGAGLIFIVGVVMTISGIMDWWKAKQDN